MIKIKLVLGSILISMASYGQDQITLDSCINAAYLNLEFNTQAGYINEGRTHAMDGNNHYNLPTFEVNGNRV